MDLPGNATMSPAGPEVTAPLTFAQRRLWFVQQLSPENTAYHFPLAVRMRGRLDIAALQRSFEILIERHETLRTRFQETDDGEPVQVIVAPFPLLLRAEEVEGTTGDCGLAREMSSAIDRPFDL